MANPRKYIVFVAIMAAFIAVFSTLGGLYLTNRLGFQKETPTEETLEVSSVDQPNKIDPSESEEEIRQIDTSATTDKVYWKNKEDHYFMYFEGNRIDQNTNSSWSGSDLLVYDQTTKKTFLLEDFEKRNDNTLRLAKELGQGQDKAYWKQRDNKYYMYYEGNRIDEHTNSSWSDGDLLVYDQKSKKSFLCKDFETLNDNVLRAAKEVTK